MLSAYAPSACSGAHTGDLLGFDAEGFRVEVIQLRSAVAPAQDFDQAALFRFSTSGTPPADSSADGQELCFVLDVSSSMRGRSLDVSRILIADVLRNLRDADTAHLVTYNTGAGARVEFSNATRLQSDAAHASLRDLPSLLDTVALLPQRRASQPEESSGLARALEVAAFLFGIRRGGAAAPAAASARRPQRVFVVSDGASSTAAAREEALEHMERLQRHGVVSGVLAVGGRRNERAQQAMAKAGNGRILLVGASAESAKLVREETIGRALPPFAFGAKLWLTPQRGATDVHAFVPGGRSAASRAEIAGRRFGTGVEITLGTLPYGHTAEVLAAVRVPATLCNADYLHYQLSFVNASGSAASIAGYVRVHVKPPEQAACEETDDAVQDEVDTFPIIAGARWEATWRWNCGAGYANLTSHVQAPRGTRGGKEGRKYCAARCLESPSCVAFSYPNLGDGRCWLKVGDARQSRRLDANCGGPDIAWDYYTFVERSPVCIEARCSSVLVTGTKLLHGSTCPRDRTDDKQSTAAGVYTCSPDGGHGKNRYRLKDGPITWDLVWESGSDFGARYLGQRAGLANTPKWVLYGNGWYRYFATADTPEPPEFGWLPRSQSTDDHACAEGSISVARAQRPSVFLASAGRCSDLAGEPIMLGRLVVGRRTKLECEAECLERRDCTAYEYNNTLVCALHTDPLAAASAGGGQLGATCYPREEATQFSAVRASTRCVNARKVLSTASVTSEACADMAASDTACGDVFMVFGGSGSEAELGEAMPRCACLAPGTFCQERQDADSTVYEITKAFGRNAAIGLLLDYERLLEREEDADAALRQGRPAGDAQASLAQEVYALAARAKKLLRQDPGVARLGIAERIIEFESHWHSPGSSCDGPRSSCLAGEPPAQFAPPSRPGEPPLAYVWS